MTVSSNSESGQDWRQVADRIREEMARRRMSRQGLADQSRISLSTLEKALSGKRSFTLPTLVRVEQVLGISLRQAAVPSSQAEAPSKRDTAATAPEELGSYSRQSVSWLEGSYLTLRPGFTRPEAVYAYLTTIVWDDAKNCLVFQESQRQDARYAQTGLVAAPYLSSHIYLVTNDRGQFRTLTLGRPTQDRVMHGILNTLLAGDGTQLVPVSCPVVLRLLGDGEAATLGELLPGQEDHQAARTLLDTTITSGFARFNL